MTPFAKAAATAFCLAHNHNLGHSITLQHRTLQAHWCLARTPGPGSGDFRCTARVLERRPDNPDLYTCGYCWRSIDLRLQKLDRCRSSQCGQWPLSGPKETLDYRGSWRLGGTFVVIADFFEFSKFLPHLCAIICGESTLTSNLMKKFLFSALFMAVASASQGAVIAYTWEEGGDVKTEYSGSLNLTGLSYVTAQGRSQYDYLSIQSNRSMFFNLTDYDPYFGASIVATVSGVNNGEVLGTGAWITQTSRFGSQFGYGRRSGGGGAVYVGYQYASGDAIDGGTVAENTTLAAFGITAPSTLVFSWSGDSITHYYGTRPPAVPLPAGLPLIATGLGAFAWLRRRNKTA